MPMIPVPGRKMNKLLHVMRDRNVFPVFLDRVEQGTMGGVFEAVSHALDNVLDEVQEYLGVYTEGELRATHDAIYAFYQHFISLDSLLHGEPVAVRQTALYYIVTVAQARYFELGAIP